MGRTKERDAKTMPKIRTKDEEVRRADFARRLLAERVKKGWNQSELARAAAIHMPDRKFGRDNVSKYEKGSTPPTPLHLNALAKALSVPSDSLLSNVPGIAEAMEVGAKPAFRTLDDSTVHLRINQVVERSKALKIIAMLEEE